MILRSLGAQWLAIGFVGLVSLAVSILIARVLGPDRFGVYTIALSAGSLVAILLDGGFSRLLQREGVRASESLKEVSSILPRLAYSHAILMIAALSILAGVIIPQYAITAVATVLFFGISVLNQFGFSILRGEGRLVRDASWQICNRTITALCIGAALLYGAVKPWQVLTAQFIGTAAFGFLIVRYLRVRPLFTISPVVYRAVLPFIWLDFATALYFRADMVLLHLLGVPKFEVGKYGVSYRLIEAVVLFSSPVGMILLRRFRQDNVSSKQMVEKMLPVLLISAALIGIALLILLLVFGNEIIALGYGQAYEGAGGLLAVLGCSLVFILPNGVLNQAALAMGLERWFATSAFIAAVVNIASNLLFIPIYGVRGAAWVTVLTEAVLGVCVGTGVLLRGRQSAVAKRSA
ncbi:MAG: hypothetical protein JWP38_1766 [Herbaspirillum sp.]|nr:hypothetical protein [Herbaspirillum sp.]